MRIILHSQKNMIIYLKKGLLSMKKIIFLLFVVFFSVTANAEYSDEIFSGLIGFENEYELAEGNSPVSVIVLFRSNPAEVQPFAIDDEHKLFRRELDALFGEVQPMSPPYEIGFEYRRALSGVSLTLPSDMAEELLNFQSVRAIFPNETIFAEPPEFIVENNPRGVAEGRESMRANEMHDLGYKGEGVLVAVIFYILFT